VLASVAARLRASFTPARLRLVNIASGLLILAFGVQALVSAAGST
jgi:threonine/homoserine/homoserine lactone efflux protein